VNRAQRQAGGARRPALVLAALAVLCAWLWPGAGAVAAAPPLAASPFAEPGGRLLAADEEGGGRFGASVAVSADGSTALVGAPSDGGLLGAAFVFTRTGSAWTQQGPKLTVPASEEEDEETLCKQEPGECGLGASVALSADGNTALLGAPRQNGESGAAWVFTRSGSTWAVREELTPGPDAIGNGRFGRAVALSADGREALIGAPKDHINRGAAWAFADSGGGFAVEGPKLVGPQQPGESYFGRSVALSGDGAAGLVGAPGEEAHAGSVWAFADGAEGWAQQGPKLSGAGESGAGRFGFSVAISGDGSTALVGGRLDAGGAGAAWPFTHGESGWTAQGPKLTPSDGTGAGNFGYSTALSANGNVALIGGPHDSTPLGAAWTFAREGGGWSQQGLKLAPEEPPGGKTFGSAVALAANNAAAVIGGPREETNAGTAWSFLGTALPPPEITNITPSSGPVAGGTPVTIEGSGFLAGASVSIGGAAGTVKVLSETKITAVTPAHAAGSEEVAVSDLYGSSSGSPSFTYEAPPQPPVEEEPQEPPAPPTGKGTTQTAITGQAGVLASITSSLAPPKFDVAGNLLPVSGVVRIKTPGSPSFVSVGSVIQVPFGTIVDATLGKVTITTVDAGGATQTVTFYSGEFKITQAKNGSALATLLGGSFSSCPKAKHRHRGRRASAARKKRVRKLWAEGHGKYSTKGNYATGAALGTRWVTEDFCEGTLIRVVLHRVSVTDLVTHRHFTVKAGHSYFAKAP
jgi:hypothetical protein